MLNHIKAAFPDGEVLINLEPEELGAKLLFLLREHGGNSFHPGNIEIGLDSYNFGHEIYPRGQINSIGLALREAFAWLRAQGLIISASGANGQNGLCILSRRARKFQNEREFASYSAARRLPKDALHPRISNAVWNAFMRNEFDVAAFLAMKAVEVSVREAGAFDSGNIGVKLMRAAFHPETGVLRDINAEGGERQALSDLFTGAIGAYKNPHSHRDVNLNDPAEAVEIIMLANLLLRIVDARAGGNNIGKD
jgi:uncharacterized protein (TIGR02391 family)